MLQVNATVLAITTPVGIAGLRLIVANRDCVVASAISIVDRRNAEHKRLDSDRLHCRRRHRHRSDRRLSGLRQDARKTQEKGSARRLPDVHFD